MKPEGGATKKYEIMKEEVRNWLFIWIFYGTVSTLRRRGVNVIWECGCE
jgi:hypothetical protein